MPDSVSPSPTRMGALIARPRSPSPSGVGSRWGRPTATLMDSASHLGRLGDALRHAHEHASAAPPSPAGDLSQLVRTTRRVDSAPASTPARASADGAGAAGTESMWGHQHQQQQLMALQSANQLVISALQSISTTASEGAHNLTDAVDRATRIG